MSEKTLSLQERRQLEQAVAGLAEITSESALVNAARTIIHTYPAGQVLTVLVKHLDTSSSQLRGGLAHLAALLPPEEIIPSLRRYATSRQNPPQGRFAAATILERSLGESISPGMLNDLQSNDDAAFQSLSEAVAESKQNRYILFEYVTQMREHDEGIAFAVMDAVARLPAADQVELLRLVAQDERETVAQSALQRLDQLAASGENRAAVRALVTLRHILPQKSAEAIERLLRKLQLRGKGYKAPSFANWRALLGAADPAGNQALWLIESPTANSSVGSESEKYNTLISCMVNLHNGMLAFYCSEQIDSAMLPPKNSSSPIVKAQTENGESTFLEAPVNYGLWLAQAALSLNHKGEGAILLPGDYQLYSDLIWQFDPVLDAGLAALLVKRMEAVTSDPPKLDADELELDVELLLAHPAMAMWIFRGLPGSSDPVSVFGKRLSTTQLAMVILREIALVPERTQLIAALDDGLRLQAVWLHLAGESELAQRAQRLAQALPLLSIIENPLLHKMVERGLGE